MTSMNLKLQSKITQMDVCSAVLKTKLSIYFYEFFKN